MIGYTKLFGTILDSTIWREDKETKILWITMLAMAGREGLVEASIPGLADRAKLTVPETEKALACLQAPDTYSRTKEHQGRRIQEMDGGWLILNHGKYREKMSADERRDYLRRKQAERRAKLKPVNAVSTLVNNCSGTSTMLSHSEAEAEAEAVVPPNPPKGGREVRSTIKTSTVIPEPLNVPEFRGAWTKWLEHRKQLRKPATLHAQDLQLLKLAGLGVKRAVDAINHSIAQGWVGIFEAREAQTVQGPQNVI